MSDRASAVVSSAQWAAYADALGFITELADEKKLRERVGTKQVQKTVPWRRYLPGRVPVRVEFPAGTYSDDTQLRLAVSRAIRADGTFDVASFAKIELPAWTNYALGAGISSKEAAFNLSKSSSNWHSNFFKNKRADYLSGGGNGAAMRVQPHVWAQKPSQSIRDLLVDVVRDSVCTHGHARGILGACFHALTVKHAIDHRRPPSLADLRSIILYLENVWNFIRSDDEMNLFWVPQWELAQDASGEILFLQVVEELLDDLERLMASTDDGYESAVSAVKAREPSERGSATKTALLAAWLAATRAPERLNETIVETINSLGTDTDSIGTMLGAIAGACVGQLPFHPIQDLEYITREAERLARVADNMKVSSFGYPDLRSFSPPKTSLDVILDRNGTLIVLGLGEANALDSGISFDKDNDLQWLKLDFGQTILAKVRSNPRSAPLAGPSLFELPRELPPTLSPKRASASSQRKAPVQQRQASSATDRTLDAVTAQVIASNFDRKMIGDAFAEILNGNSDTLIEEAIGFAAIIAKAFSARRSRN